MNQEEARRSTVNKCDISKQNRMCSGRQQDIAPGSAVGLQIKRGSGHVLH